MKLMHILLLLGSSIGTCKAEESIYSKIGNVLLDADDYLNKPVITSANQVEKKNNAQLVDDMLKPLTISAQQEILYNLYARLGQFQTTKSIIEPYSLRELNVLCGSEQSKKLNLFNKINKTRTIIGSSILARVLSEPINNKELISQRQKLIELLCNNVGLLKTLDDSFLTMTEHEGALFQFWGPHANVNISLRERVYMQSFLSRFNKNPHILSFIHKFSLATAAFCSVITVGQASWLHARVISDRTKSSLEKTYWHLGILGADALYCYTLKKMWDELKLNNHIGYTLHKRMYHIHNLVKTFKSIYKDLKPYSKEIKCLKAFGELDFFINDAKLIDQKLASFLKMLDHGVFKKRNISWYDSLGTALAAHELMHEVKDYFVKVIEAIGEIEAYVSMAKLMLEYKDKELSFCMVNLIEQENPSLSVIDCWNPLIEGTCVAETITVGKPQGAHNIMLTGPHGGGKSTFMKSLAYVVILGQTFGIAPAKKASFTTFSHLNSYTNIKEDLSQGQSTFMAEKKRVDEIIDVVKKLDAKNFGFTVMDEVFKGTMEAEGSVRLYKFGQQIAHNKANMSIIATHFEKPAHLEADTKGEFTNYHVGLIENDDKTFTRTFKLIKGKNEWWFGDAAKRERYIDWLTSQS